MGTSIGGVIDYLISGTNPATGTTLLADLKAIDPFTVLADNEPGSESQSLVVIGRQQFDGGTAQSGTDAYVVMGATRITEDYALDCYIQVYRDGPAQKIARDAAIALFDAVVHWVHADPTMNLLLEKGRIALVSNMTLLQTQNSDDAAGGDLRTAEIDFSLHVQNHYVP